MNSDNAVTPASAARGRPSDRSSWKPAADVAMNRYAQGDDAAFAALYELLAPRLRAFLVRQTRDPNHAEDIVQQTFLQMHGARFQFAAGAPVMPWAFAIARRILTDRRRAGKHNAVLTPVEHEAMQVPASNVLPDRMASLRYLTQQVEEALAGLPEAHVLAFELTRLGGLSVAEAAEVLGTTTTAVKMRVHRAYVALRRKLGRLVLEGL